MSGQAGPAVPRSPPASCSVFVVALRQLPFRASRATTAPPADGACIVATTSRSWIVKALTQLWAQIACDGLPRPAGGTCVAPGARVPTAATGGAEAPAVAGAGPAVAGNPRVATAVAAGNPEAFTVGAALDACTGVSGNWVKGIFCA